MDNLNQNQEGVLSKKQERRLRRQKEKLARQMAQGGGSSGNKLRPWLIAILIILASIYGIVALSRSGGDDDKEPTKVQTELTKINANDWVRGNPLAKTILVEYSDFECPACGAYAPIVKSLVDEMGTDFALVYRHFPLGQHLGAKPAAYAAEAAGAQGRFWEMADMIFENQDKWEGRRNVDSVFEGYATTLGLDLAKFKTDRDSKATRDRVAADTASGEKFLVTGTPTFYLNGKKIANPGGLEEFKKLLTEAIGSVSDNANATSTTQ